MAKNKDLDIENSGETKSAARVSLTEVFSETLQHWPWILVSVLVFVALGALYCLCTPSKYMETADLLIKDEEGGSNIDVMSAISDLGFGNTNTNVIDEITNLQSRDLMEEVVRRLDLDRSLYARGTFKKQLLYGLDLPVNVDLSGVNEESRVSFNLDVTTDGKVEISKLMSQKRKNGNIGQYEPKVKYKGKIYTGKIGSPIKTPAGTVTVNRADNFSTKKDMKLFYTKQPIGSTARQFAEKLGVKLNDKKDGSVINLQMQDFSEQRADDILATVIGVYNELWIIDKNKIANSTDEFIAERLQVIESELGNVDNDISTFKSANLVPDVGSAAEIYLRQGEKSADEIMQVGSALQMSRYIRSYLAVPENYDKLLPANTGIDNLSIERQIEEYNKMMLQREALANKSSDQNPLVENLDRQLASQRSAILVAVDNQIYNLTTQLRASQQAENAAKGKIASGPRQAKYLLSVERQQKVKEELYLYLLQKREENQLSKTFTATNTRVVNRPGSSGRPATPQKSRVLQICFILGLIVPFVYYYVVELNDTKVRRRKDVEDLKVPFLGEVPKDINRRKKNDPYAVVVKEGKRDVINESFRVLRTNVEFMKKKGEDAEVIALTSFNAHSGKSFLSVNLGKVLSLKRKRVLVIDADLRHSSASQYVDSPDKGLSTILNAEDLSHLSSLIVPCGDSKYLSVLPAGSQAPNPAELLERGTFKDLIEQLRKEYDYIIVDCPPIEIVADAQIINPYMDRTVFVLRAGLAERSMLAVLDKLYEEKKYKNMSVILNYTPIIRGKFRSSRSYGGGYGYGYEYGSD